MQIFLEAWVLGQRRPIKLHFEKKLDMLYGDFILVNKSFEKDGHKPRTRALFLADVLHQLANEIMDVYNDICQIFSCHYTPIVGLLLP
jgi:hypothetical protein